jgi:hypothetical protein
MTSRLKWIFGMTLIGLLLTSGSTNASVVLTISVSGYGITPGQSETIASPSISTSFGGYTISYLSFRSNESAGTLSLGSYGVTNNTSGGILTLTLTDNSMVTPSYNILGLTSTESVSVNSGPGTITFQSFLGTTPNQFATPLLSIGQTSSLTPTTTLVSTSTSGFTVPASTYSLTSVSTFNFGTGQSTEAFTGYSVVSTPEPATLVMTLSGLPVVGFFAWRHRRRERLAVRA